MPSTALDGLIAARIREEREYLELSVEEFAAMLSVDADDVEVMESGSAPISAGRLAEVAKILGRSLEFFTGAVPASAVSERTEFLARAAETLSDQDMGELKRFATYLRSRSESQAA